MESMTLTKLIEMGANFGLSGIVLVIWFLSDRAHERTLKKYREDMIEQRAMYANNVELVKATQTIANNQQDLIIMATQTLTKVCEKIDGNVYCPMVRLKKDAIGPQD